MKNNLTTDDQAGWYECRFLRNPPDCRVVRWWSGKVLHHTKHETTPCDSREYTEFVALNRNEWEAGDAWQFACDWYPEEQIARSIQKTRSIAAEPHEKIPEDVYSHEFAKWLTDQYRLAMAKGIQIGRGRD